MSDRQQKHEASLIIIVVNSSRWGVTSTAEHARKARLRLNPARTMVEKSSITPTKRNAPLSIFCATMLSVTMRSGAISSG